MFKGSIVALVTPFENGKIDEEKLKELVEFQIENGTSGIVPCGTTGESPTLNNSEHLSVVQICVEAANKRVPILAGTGSNSTAEAIDLTQHAEKAGADGALVVTPYYNKPSQEGLYRHFREVAEGVDIPQILYNVPGRTACDLALETVNRLADLENIVAIKDATGVVSRGLELVSKCGDRLAVYSGEDAISLPLILGGAAGTISVTANVAPALMSEMCALALSGEEAAATAIDDKLALLHRDLFLEANPVPVKWALQKMGLIESGIRLPLVELDRKYHNQVNEALLQAGINLAAAA
jgi:4-hydroxy-tetrahydrodipicolinate synthase